MDAGLDRSVVLGGKTYLAGQATWLEAKPQNVVRWGKESGPGTVSFADATAAVTTATFSAPGDYVLQLNASGLDDQPAPTIRVHAEPSPPKNRLDVVYTRQIFD